uniref:Uncharacterized protein n=1 Tax=Oryzias melastigma TaxID=30732 RepID=A0A3B3CU46_ORYME
MFVLIRFLLCNIVTFCHFCSFESVIDKEKVSGVENRLNQIRGVKGWKIPPKPCSMM